MAETVTITSNVEKSRTYSAGIKNQTIEGINLSKSVGGNMSDETFELRVRSYFKMNEAGKGAWNVELNERVLPNTFIDSKRGEMIDFCGAIFDQITNRSELESYMKEIELTTV